MSCFCKTIFLILFSPFLFFIANAQNLVINEIMSSNRTVIFDEDRETPDWIEILNTSSENIKLNEYYLSDDILNPGKWQLPEIELEPNQPFLIFASGKDRRITPMYWYTLIDKGDIWKYKIPTEEPATDWKSVEFDDTSWNTGASGIGYGDGDDETEIPKSSLSVFMRQTITITNIDTLKSMWLHIDFDDAFVAYLNGVEVAREGIGKKGEPVAFNKDADVLHEAQIYKGGNPEKYDLSEFTNLLLEGENTLSIQVHNKDIFSSDFSAIPIFTVGYLADIEINEPVTEYMQLSTQYSHTNFKLSSSGETVVLSNQNQEIVDSVSYNVVPGGCSFGREFNSLQNWGFFTVPTPGIQNGSNVLNEVVENRVHFSINEMFISAGKELVLSGAANNEEIRYALNGVDPTATSSLYSNPIEINKNTVVKARIFKANAVPGYVTSRTYLTDEMPELPVVSVSTEPDNLWNNETGIYILGDSYEENDPHRGANYWEDWEKPASIEMATTTGNRLFNLNCGIKIFGGWSRMQAQKSLAVFFRKEYGDPELKNVQLFDSKPIENFKSLVLRNGGNDGGTGKIRDGMMTSLVNKMDIDLQAFQPTVMYLNGEYWGIINLREKVNENYLESNYDVQSDEVDLLEWNASVVEGSNEHYLALIEYVENNDLSDNAVFEELSKQMDISNFIDYQLSQIYFNNRDWPGNNIKYWRPQTDDGKWRWIMYDTDFGFSIWKSDDYKLNTLYFATTINGEDWPNPPWSTFMLRKLLENTTFKNHFINRYADVLNTTFQPQLVINHIDSVASLLRSEIPSHFSKWGKLWPESWEQSVENMRLFAANRVDYTRDHIKQQFSIFKYYNVKVDILPSNSGEVQLNSLRINKSGWSGDYFQDVPIKLTANAYAGYKFHSWKVNGVTILDKTILVDVKKITDVHVIYEDVEDDGNSIVFNEINYNSPEGESAGDWVEIYNWGRFDLDISNWIFKDSENNHEFIIPENTVLKSKEYLVLSKETEKFIEVHSDIKNYIGEFGFGLSSTGDQARLFDRYGQLVDEVDFSSENPWPNEPNGVGTTLELRQYFHDNNIAEFWRSSLVEKGTPGRENSVTTESEWMAKNDNKQLKVYPNPFKDKIHIQLLNNNSESMNVSIFSLDGRMICNESTFNNEFIWNGENSSGQKLKPGIYICKVQSGGEIFTSKIILNN